MLMGWARAWEIIVDHQFHGRYEMRLGMAYLHLPLDAYRPD